MPRTKRLPRHMSSQGAFLLGYLQGQEDERNQLEAEIIRKMGLLTHNTHMRNFCACDSCHEIRALRIL